MYKVKFNLLCSTAILTLALVTTTAAEAQSEQPISVDAESVGFDSERGATHLRENVVISHGELEVRASEGFGYQTGGRYSRIELFGSPATWHTVTEEGGETRGESEQIIYDLAANRVTMVGAARIRDSRGSFSGNRLIYDLESQRTEGDGGIQMIIEPDAIPESDGTDGARPPD